VQQGQTCLELAARDQQLSFEATPQIVPVTRAREVDYHCQRPLGGSEIAAQECHMEHSIMHDKEE
jgi:hypothetical protein